MLFAGSIRDNIAEGKSGATDDEVTAAAKAANAHDVSELRYQLPRKTLEKM